MAKFITTVPINMRWLGNELVGAAGTTHRIPDALYDEFAAEFQNLLPSLVWITQDETTSQFTGNVLIGTATATAVLTKGIPWYNVRAYGAVGDNSTDDTAAFQAAMAAANAATGTVYVPKGTYKITGGLTMAAEGVRLKGEGIYNTKIRAVGVAGPIITMGDTLGTQYNGMGIADIGIFGDSTATYGVLMLDGAVFGLMDRVLVRDVTGSPGAGVGQSNTTDDEHWTWTYKRMIFRNNVIGLMLRQSWQHTVVEDCVFTAHTSFGIDAAGNPTDTNGGKLFIRGGTIERNGTVADTTGGLYLRGVNLVTVRDIYGESNSQFPGFFICVDQDSVGESSSEVLVEGCYWTGSGQATKGVILKNGRGVTIRNNRFRNAVTATISYEGGTLTGLKVYDNTHTDVSDASAQRRELQIPLGDWAVETGTPAAVAFPPTGSTFDRMIGVAFDSATNEGIQTFPVFIPDDFKPSAVMAVKYVWSAAQTTGAVVWQAFVAVLSADEAANASEDLATSVTASVSATQYGIKTSRVGASGTITVSPGDIVRLGIRRQAANVGDTLADDATLLAVFLSLVDA